MANPELSASCISNKEVTDAPRQRFGETRAFALERVLASCLSSLLLILVFPGLAPAQDTFSRGSGSGTSAAPTTYGDQFASSCEQSEPPNVFKQVGMNPLVCHGQVGPQDSQKQCSYAGMKMIAHIGETCYYCAPIVPPMNGIIIPFDQVRNATNQGFSCYGDQVDPDCLSICTKPGSLNYTPPPISGGTPNPVPVTGGPPANKSGPMPGPAGGIGYVPGPNPCIAGGGYNYCNNGPGARLPAGCVCSQLQPAPFQQATSPQVPDFNNKLLDDAQTLLQNAGRISKVMTDQMDVTKHNNVGVGIAVGAYFGALGKLMGVVAQEYQVLAAAGRVVADESSVLQIAGEAATESGTTANQAEQALKATAQAGSAGSAGGPVMGAPVGSGYLPSGPAGYMQGATIIGEAGVVQGKLPTCAVLSCGRLAELLGRNVGTMRLLDNLKPSVKLVISATGQTSATGGLTAPQVAAGLKAVGINAAVGNGVTNMMNQVRAGTPVIAGMYESGAAASAGGALHAVVVEQVSTVGEVSTLTIWDPRGWLYTQSAQEFGTYFSQVFVHPL